MGKSRLNAGFCALRTRSDGYYAGMLDMAENLANVFRQNVRRRMEQLKMNQAELAKRLNVTDAYISRILNGARNPGLQSLEQFADVLDTTASRLLEEKHLSRSA